MISDRNVSNTVSCLQHIPGTMLPVIMVSAKSNEDNIVDGLRSGSNDFIRKPYQREELLVSVLSYH